MNGALIGAFLVSAVTVAAWAWAIHDALWHTPQIWSEAGRDRLAWVVIIIVGGVIGVTLYLLMARPDLMRVRRT